MLPRADMAEIDAFDEMGGEIRIHRRPGAGLGKKPEPRDPQLSRKTAEMSDGLQPAMPAPGRALSRRVHIVTNHTAALRARCKRSVSLARRRRPRLENMRIQALLTAIAMNLKKLTDSFA